MSNKEKIKLPPTDNPRRKQWECFFNGTQESLDYINRMTEICDELNNTSRRFLIKRATDFQGKGIKK